MSPKTLGGPAAPSAPWFCYLPRRRDEGPFTELGAQSQDFGDGRLLRCCEPRWLVLYAAPSRHCSDGPHARGIMTSIALALLNVFRGAADCMGTDAVSCSAQKGFRD